MLQAASSLPWCPACRSIIKSGRPLNEAGTPVLGHAQRAPAGEAPPHTITKELQVTLWLVKRGGRHCNCTWLSLGAMVAGAGNVALISCS